MINRVTEGLSKASKYARNSCPLTGGNPMIETLWKDPNIM